MVSRIVAATLTEPDECPAIERVVLKSRHFPASIYMTGQVAIGVVTVALRHHESVSPANRTVARIVGVGSLVGLSVCDAQQVAVAIICEEVTALLGSVICVIRSSASHVIAVNWPNGIFNPERASRIVGVTVVVYPWISDRREICATITEQGRVIVRVGER